MDADAFSSADIEMAESGLHLLALPEEILVNVVSQLPPRDLKELACCSRKARRIADDSPIWRLAVERFATLRASCAGEGVF